MAGMIEGHALPCLFIFIPLALSRYMLGSVGRYEAGDRTPHYTHLVRRKVREVHWQWLQFNLEALIAAAGVLGAVQLSLRLVNGLDNASSNDYRSHVAAIQIGTCAVFWAAAAMSKCTHMEWCLQIRQAGTLQES